jgi:hypothetical protein
MDNIGDDVLHLLADAAIGNVDVQVSYSPTELLVTTDSDGV